MKLPLANLPDAPELRIALLIDADNSSADHVAQIEKELEARGKITIRRAYGNWANPHLSPWSEGLRVHAIEAVQLFNVSNGKNAADIRLVIDAMEIFHSNTVETFALVSSDSDFTPLCVHLRAAGNEVFGFGKLEAPKSFVQSCTKFRFLEAPKDRLRRRYITTEVSWLGPSKTKIKMMAP